MKPEAMDGQAIAKEKGQRYNSTKQQREADISRIRFHLSRPRRRRRPPKGVVLLRRALLLVSVTLLLAAGYLAVDYIRQGNSTKKLQEELRAQRAQSATMEPTTPPAPTQAAMAALAQGDAAAVMPPLPAPTARPLATPGVAMLPHLISSYSRNKDLAGWLQSDAIQDIDFPVVQRDNDYYVHRDFYGRSNLAGTVFLDEDNYTLPQDQNLVLHGHNMKNGTMFGKLARLMNRSTLVEAPFFSFSTLYEGNTYVPYAVSLTSVDPSSSRYFNFIHPQFADAADFEAYSGRLTALSGMALPVDLQADDRLLTLVTCHGQDENERLVVALRALRPGESREGLQALIREKTITR
jgi:sortase B